VVRFILGEAELTRAFGTMVHLVCKYVPFIPFIPFIPELLLLLGLGSFYPMFLF
jgi:hypothetical protein